MINAPTGKWGFNPEKQRQTKLVKDHSQFFHYLLGTYNRCSMNIINNNVAIATIPSFDKYTSHKASNVYIAAFITSSARVKIYADALLPLGEKVLYMDTDSVIYVSPTGEPLIQSISPILLGSGPMKVRITTPSWSLYLLVLSQPRQQTNPQL